MYSFSSYWSVLHTSDYFQTVSIARLVKTIHMDIQIYSTVDDFIQFNDVGLYLR